MLRTRDYLYLIFFLIHIPIIFLIDTVPLQPAAWRSDLSLRLREYYVVTYRDKFFEGPVPTWFSVFIWMELLYHVPVSIWAVWGLLKGLSQTSPCIPGTFPGWWVQKYCH